MQARRIKAWLVRGVAGLGLASGLLLGLDLLLAATNLAPLPSPLPSPLGEYFEIPTTGANDLPCQGAWARRCADKAEHFRIVVIGGSAAAGLPYPATAAFSAQLERLVRRADPSLKVEVLNLGTPGWSSRQLRWFVPPRLGVLQPDLLVIYSGNNEFWELRALRALHGGPSAHVFAARQLLGHSAIYRLLLARLSPRQLDPHQRDPSQPGSDEADDEQRPSHLGTSATAADRRVAAWSYRRNLDAMVQAAQQADVPVLMATVATEQLSRPDGHSTRPPLQGDCPSCADEVLARAPEEGLSLWYFESAEELLERGDLSRARALFAYAEYVDPSPDKSNFVLRAIQREVADAHDVPVCELHQALVDASRRGVTGPEEFFDWCHPTPRGHGLLALALADCIAGDGLVPGLTAAKIETAARTGVLTATDPWRVDRLPALQVTNGRPDSCTLPDGPGAEQTCQGHSALAALDVGAAPALYSAALDAGAPAGPTHVNLAIAHELAGDIRSASSHAATALHLLGPQDGADVSLLADRTPAR